MGRSWNSSTVALWPALAAFVLLIAGLGRRRFTHRAIVRPRSSDHIQAAARPAEIVAPGWRGIARRVWSNVSEHRVMAIAAGVTFYALLAIPPTLAAVIAIYGLFSDTASITAQLDRLGGVLPAAAVGVIRDQLMRLLANQSALGLAFAISLALSLWSANSGTKALIDSLNVVHGEREKRGLIVLNLLSLAITAGAVVFAVLTLAIVVAVPIALRYLGLESVVGDVLEYGRWPALLVLVALPLSVIYRYGPSRTARRWRWVTLGSMFAALAWLGASVLFSWYAANFANYNETYGSLGAVVGLMMWLWLTSVVVLIGAELDAELEISRKPRPYRGAVEGAVRAESDYHA